MTQTLEKKKYSIKTDFSLLSILLIPIGVALNVVGDQLVAALSLPLYLDSFGAVLAGYLAGPWVGMLTGVLTNVLTGIVRNPTLLPYAITNGCIGLMAGLFARAQWPNGKLWKVALMLLIMSVGTICTSAPISVFAYGGISGNGTTTFARGSQLTVKTGTTTISNRVINNGATLNLTFDNGFSGRYELITDGGSLDREFSIAGNNLYNITGIENGIYNVNKKSAAEVSTATGATGNQAAALTALTAGKADNAVFNAVADAVSAMAQSTDRTQVKAALDAVTALAPEVSPMVQHTQSQTANQIFGAVGTRFAGGTIAAAEGTSSGDSGFERAAVWIQGLFNKSKRHDTARTEGFDADSSGVAVGAEKFVTDNFKIGLGYAYANTDIDGFMRSTDVDTHSAILYGEYKPSQWYVNGIATYGWSDYSEGKNVAGIGVDADYDVETFGLQAMTGYELQSESFVFVPETGLRYVHISQDAYKDSADQRVSANGSDLLTGVLGARINRSWEFENGISLKPEARFALTYDLVNDAGGSVVTLANGSAYAVDGEALDRFGMELGVGVTAEVDDNIEVSLGYEGKFREKYHDHTGLLNAKYKF